MEGEASGSLLYTSFGSITHREDNGQNDSAYWLKNGEYKTLRPMADMKVGLGWGSYFDRQNYHFDLLATYDFTMMWGQNMMRSLVGTYNGGNAYEACDLHLQGVTATVRFDF